MHGLRIEIENKDDQPLNIDKIKASFLKKYLVAKLNKNQNYTLKFGDENARFPEYDLVNFKANVSENINVVNHSEISLIEKIKEEPIVSNDELVEDPEDQQEESLTDLNKEEKKEPSIFEDRLIIWSILVFVGLILTFVSIKMIKEIGKRKEL